MKTTLSPFFQGILGGIIGVFILFLLIVGVVKIWDKINTISLTCEKEKVTSSRGIECQLLEIKDLGDLLKVEDIVSPPPEVELKDQKTTGKFIQVKYKIKNGRKEPVGAPVVYLIDGANRKYGPGWHLSYWIPQEYKASNILPGLEKEIIEIFETAKDSREPFKIKIEIFLTPFLD